MAEEQPAAPAALRPNPPPFLPWERGPVRDCNGLPVWRVVVSSPREMTCTVCGETSIDGRCWRCGKGTESARTKMVPTTTYLREDEYVLAMRA